MSEAKHTPGPWISLRGKASMRVATEDFRNLALVFFPRPNAMATREANANLIAAAPELLDALKDAIAIIDRRDRGFDPTVSIGDLRQQVIDRADDAIAKAEGRS